MWYFASVQQSVYLDVPVGIDAHLFTQGPDDLAPGFMVEYLFIDAAHEGLRDWGCSRGIPCARGICRDGRKVLLHLALSSRESYDNCLDFIRDMVGRGLHTPILATTDGAPGLIQAVEEV